MSEELPKMGRPAKKPVEEVKQIPFEIGQTVLSVCSVPAAELESCRAYVIADRIERPMFPCGPRRWFYRMQGFKLCNVYHDFVKPAKGVCKPNTLDTPEEDLPRGLD